MNTAYVVLHRSPDGEGSGYTIIVSSSERMAEIMVWQYLSGKPEGYRQCMRRDLLDVQLLEDFSMFEELYWSLSTSQCGVKAEYSLSHIDPPQGGVEQPKLVAYNPPDKSSLTYGGNGHQKEYILNVAGHGDGDNYIPGNIDRELTRLLPGFDICNRGSRIEIVGKQPYGFRDDDGVAAAVKQVVGENLVTRL